MEGPTAKKRRPNFSEAEVYAMVCEVAKRKKIILGKLDSRGAIKLKNHAWEEVVKAVNVVAQIPRNVEEVRRNFSDLRESVKNKAAQDKKYTGGTGGGPQIENTYTAIEEAVLQLLDPVSIHGIPGDVESEEPINEEEREQTSGPSGARFTALRSREDSMLRPVQEKEDSSTIVLTEDIQEHDITVPIVLLEPEASSHQNIQESSSSKTYFGERCSSSKTGKPLAATTEQQSRSLTPSATADDNQTRSTLTAGPTDEPGSSQIASWSRSGSRPRTLSALKDANLIPELLQVQSQMRDCLVKLVANTECIASSLQTIAKIVQSKNPTP
ncbi:myb/SANT-like DNA-binding domain-containing protein 4 isoform X1 [Homarus americanus]|uniref:myb/SANT-like DNA-binding domain-containing protein 4 isoform X1 n=1 Tax=Homarus americanus TaxID=6706 RepID=UPI001C474424|nr:myb/SANT-like DNA-binding domain-containing protein 4 isoform X1 [Homarus americanus]XP_042214209.1 myb/SANT-like DNA-binding domain-containing protein 4 isoform X1 [Homarus americanus]